MEHQTINSQIVSRETFDKTDQLISNHRNALESYLEKLLWWNKRVNLVSRDVSRETIWEHIRHSLLLSQFKVFKSAKIIVDAGTGGGLPGIPLSITHPEKHFVLNDLVTKKCLAMKQMVKQLELPNVAIVDGSIEAFNYDESFLPISKHAFKINEMYEMTAALPWSTMIFYKGNEFEEELKGIPESFKIESYDLAKGSEFYEGKSLVFVTRS